MMSIVMFNSEMQIEVFNEDDSACIREYVPIARSNWFS
jgi:hypothetical protein